MNRNGYEKSRFILLADDDHTDVELILAALEDSKLDIPVVVVPDGAEALDFLYRRNAFSGRPEGRPALIVLDLKMCKVDGLEALRKIKADPRLKRIPVVMFSSSEMEADIHESYRSGASAYIVKPIDFEGFVAAVATIGRFWGTLNASSPPPVPWQEEYC